MNDVALLDKRVNLYSTEEDLTSYEYKLHLASMKSMDTSNHDDLREQNERLTEFLERIHYTHDNYRSELLQLKERLSDLTLELEDERHENKNLKEKLFLLSETSEAIDVKKASSVNKTAKLEDANQQLMLRLLASEKKHAASREKLTLEKQAMLKQIKELKAGLSHKEKSAADTDSQEVHCAWEKVGEELPKKSGIYFLTDGTHQCVGYFNFDHGVFAKTTYFAMPTHWMPRPELPKTNNKA